MRPTWMAFPPVHCDGARWHKRNGLCVVACPHGEWAVCNWHEGRIVIVSGRADVSDGLTSDPLAYTEARAIQRADEHASELQHSPRGAA